ncbi:MAG TPA: GrpB family protein [Ktedonobacteraceae bacterium]|jgi:GrpB-like predicted nucleotidyltransferase (UPF0157 family)|nr:GrpB family protein [Ktedonobacteraceae bacterium]
MSDVLLISEYDPHWPAQFEEEKASIQAAIGKYVRAIEHVGSTSVPGLGAKAVLDMLIIVHDHTPIPDCVPSLEQLGYEYRGEAGVPGRHFFRKPPLSVSGFERTHHLHLIDFTDEQGRVEGESQLLFRDYLRRHPEHARDYVRLKQELAARFGNNRNGYTDGKTAFVLATVEKARQENE